ncbi:hypothetical protein QZH41_008066 [Actinostola sp. cb2023]|nr:hypothetical protein QZH41_008066 [Actinostola sp. cb2023]
MRVDVTGSVGQTDKLNNGMWTDRQVVPCLIGAADSGKTSLFAPLLSIIPPSNIARVTKQRNFNKAMITKETEVIFIDEAHVRIMDIDDWKLLTQGG